MSNVVDFDGVTRLPTDPNRVLEAAKDEVDSAIVVGWAKDGSFYFASSEPGAPEVMLLLEYAKRKLLDQMEELSGE